ncbi:hypothetical protein Goshw_002430 [Gossypium schwendimanii]|uniref:DUF7745 domain-containing protein n=1 Tax=Gossypium schwendimanii TaxID=34291 RepID=A0A7J9NCU5_GOSSC|nr:hypothetical protein [Gossypium schwendimanii]
MTFKKNLMKLTGMTDTWTEKLLKKKNEVSCFLWFSLRELVQNHLDILKRVDLFALAIYGLNVFPKVLEHIKVVNLRVKDITWTAPWIRPFVLLYKYGNQDWVPLLGLWGGVGYAPLMVQRQFALRQFVPATDGLAQSEFAFTGEGYMKKNPFSEEVPSELEMAKHEFKCEKAKLLRDISSLQEENYQLKIDV